MRKGGLLHEWQFVLWLSTNVQPDMLEVRVAGKTFLKVRHNLSVSRLSAIPYCIFPLLPAAIRNTQYATHYASIVAYLALRSMNFRRGSTESPIRVEKRRSAAAASSMVTC